MKQLITSIFTLFMAVSASMAEANPQVAWTTAEAHGRETQEIIRFCNRYAWGWLSQADPKTGLLPRTLEGSWLWNAQDCAADNFPFLLLTGYVTGQYHLKQAGLGILRRERELAARLRSLPDTYDFATGGFASEEIDKNAILFGASEYIKDGLWIRQALLETHGCAGCGCVLSAEFSLDNPLAIGRSASGTCGYKAYGIGNG
jgi:hypothetical protein